MDTCQVIPAADVNDFWEGSFHTGRQTGESLSILFDENKNGDEINKQRGNKVKLKKVFVSDAEGNIYTSRLPKFLRKKTTSLPLDILLRPS